MDGKPLQRTISSLSHSNVRVWTEILMLLGIGIVAITLHARLRYGMNLPGHHGIEFMALMMTGRLISRFPFASTISSVGVVLASLIPGLGFNDPFMGFNYLLPGLVLDIAFQGTATMKRRVLILALFSGIAYMMIPLSRLFLLLLFTLPYNAFVKHGYILPLVSFAIFGATGGGIALFGKSIINKLNRKKEINRTAP